jgi:UDP-N-acetylmuramoyl-L-alanyl-D-glutamate--2,6-diaminopimelate ligase
MTDKHDSGGAVTVSLAGFENLAIAGLSADSRSVAPGFLFAALQGARNSGVAFIAEAARRGAVAVLAPVGTKLDPDLAHVRLIEDPAPRLRFAQMAAAFYGAQPDHVVAVTGTSGKSSTVSFARQLWKKLGLSAASIGTLGVESDSLNRYGGLTTADPVALHADLATLAGAGVTRVAMEASSHGLDQFRLDGVRLRAAGFTSFGRDHLDYHATPEAYLAAKTRLFTEVLPPGGVAVLNADIPEYDRLKAAALAAGRRLFSYGRKGADLRVIAQTVTERGRTVLLEATGRRWEFELPLSGEFQLFNALCALGLVAASEFPDVSACGADPRFGLLIGAMARLQGVTGRLERVAVTPKGAAVYVDYAHKPDALVAVLEALRPHAKGRLFVVFGCGGDRDAGKRPLMGTIAASLADIVVVTDDNPRTEEPASIRAAILAGAPTATEIGDRAEAIAAAVRALRAGDILVIAGKGHEQGQIIGDTVRPFDDAAVARAAVAALPA